MTSLPSLVPAGDRSPTSPIPAGALALALSALYVLILAYPAHLHVVGVFSDFYVRYAPDADLIARRQFPGNTYNPPGYPLLLVVLSSALTGDHFTSAKWLSLVAAGLSGLLAFQLFRRLFGPWPAVLAVPILLSSGPFNRYAISAMTEVPFLCVCLAALLVVTADRPTGWRFAALAGVVCGVAYLLRYNGAFLLVPGLVAMLWREGTRASRARLAALYLGVFALVAAPWWWLNYVHHGSPFYSTNHEDTARALGLHGGGRPFGSVAGVILADPVRFAWRYTLHALWTLFQSFGASFAVLPVGPLAAAGMVLSVVRDRRRPVLLVLSGMASFILLMALTHWETRYFFLLLACYSGFAAFAIFEIARWVGRVRESGLAMGAVVAVVTLWILVPSIPNAVRSVRVTLSRQPVELLPAARHLHSVARPDATVMSLRAQIAYLSRRQWRDMPWANSVDELKTRLSANPPDYLVYDRWARRLAKPLAPLGTPDGSVPWLVPVYRDEEAQLVVYAVRLERR